MLGDVVASEYAAQGMLTSRFVLLSYLIKQKAHPTGECILVL